MDLRCGSRPDTVKALAELIAAASQRAVAERGAFCVGLTGSELQYAAVLMARVPSDEVSRCTSRRLLLPFLSLMLPSPIYHDKSGRGQCTKHFQMFGLPRCGRLGFRVLRNEPFPFCGLKSQAAPPTLPSAR